MQHTARDALESLSHLAFQSTSTHSAAFLSEEDKKVLSLLLDSALYITGDALLDSASLAPAKSRLYIFLVTASSREFLRHRQHG